MIQPAHVVLRCDASDEIGLGHAVRCLALAAALRRLRWQCTLWMAACTELVANLAARYGIGLNRLDSPWSVPTACPRPAAVVVDHYGASCEYLQTWKKRGVVLGVIDDLAARDYSHVDWLLNPHPDADRFPYRLAESCVRCLGPSYALLRPEFRRKRQTIPDGPSRPPGRILVTLGGGRHDELVIRIFRALEKIPRRLSLRLLLASDCELSVKSSRHRIEVLHNVANMAEQLDWAELAITGAGSTCWEAACLGVPMVLCCLAENQQANAAFFGRSGAARGVDPQREDDVEAALAELLGNESTRQTMRERAMSLVDGRGAERAALSLHRRLRHGSRQ